MTRIFFSNRLLLLILRQNCVLLIVILTICGKQESSSLLLNHQPLYPFGDANGNKLVHPHCKLNRLFCV